MPVNDGGVLTFKHQSSSSGEKTDTLELRSGVLEEGGTSVNCVCISFHVT